MKGVIFMITYLLIGLMVQILIIAERKIRGVVTVANLPKTGVEWAGFITGMLFLPMINILVWPISIVCEIYNIKKGA